MATRVLEYCLASGFIVVGLVCFMRGRRTRDFALWHAAAAFVLIGFTLGLDVTGSLMGYRSELVPRLSVAAFLASGWEFLMFRHRMIPLSRRARAVAASVLVATYVAIVIADIPYAENPVYTPVESALNTWLGVVWSACMAEPLYRFWRASRGKPSIQRARLRILSVGYGLSIAVAMAWTAGQIITRPGVMVAVECVALLLIPIMLISFSPPRWLRRIWRDREEVSLRAAQDLALFHAQPSDLGYAAIEWALRLVGGEAGFIVTGSGVVLGRVAVTDAEIEEFLAQGLPDEPSLRPRGVERIGLELAVPFQHEGPAVLVVFTGPFTPLVDREELGRLRAFASVVAVALDRVRLVSALNEENARYENLLRAVSDLGEGVTVTDAGRVIYANDAFCSITGYSLEELKALPSLFELALPGERELLLARMKTRMSGGQVQDFYETGLMTKDGRTVFTEVAVKLMQTTEGMLIVSVVRDITERKAHERKLHRLDALKNEFISNAAHELRTPLTAIVGLAATLAQRRRDLTEMQVEESVDALDRGARRLATLVNRLLDFTQLEEGRVSVEMQRVSLAAATRDALFANPAPEGVDVKVRVSDHITVWADPTRLDQILTNLLSNAYRYGGPEILIQAEKEQHDVVVEVADDGPGVPDSLIDNLFDPFVRGSNDQQGSGLGLAIVHRLAEAFGGTVTYSPATPHGARFRLHLKESA